jgi:hypothetical protein
VNKLWIVSILVPSIFALAACNIARPESPQQQLAAKKCNTVARSKHADPGLASYHAEPSLPTAVQFGDSVSLGYSIMARHDLCGVVDYRHDNWDTGDINLCGDANRPCYYDFAMNAGTNNGTSSGLASDMESQLNHKHFNVLLFNSGYHDVQRASLTGNVSISESDYRNNLEAVAQICEQSANICIWVDTPELDATSLPLAGLIVEESDVVAYNIIARSVAKEHGFYMLAMPSKDHDGSVHFTSLGYFNAGTVVAACVITALHGEETSDCHR